MRVVVFAAILAATVAPLAAAQNKWRLVSSFTVSWNEQANVHFSLSIPETWDTPGDFTRLSIIVPGHKQFVLANEGGWVKYGSNEASTSLEVKNLKNLIASNYVFAAKAAQNRTVLFLFGYSYASSPGSLDMLEISAEGDVWVALHREELGLKDFRDLNGDGVAEVVGYPCLSEEYGNGLLTYDPFNVYSLSNSPGGKANLSVALSKQYNLRHYYGWAGPECSEDFAVVLHPPDGGKPIVVSAKEAEKITEPTSSEGKPQR
jgi:hypothetical protein